MMENSTLPPNSTNVDKDEDKLRITYVVCEIIVALFAVIGNAFVILVFYRERRLRRRTNYYIVSLAIADLLVGLLGIPFAILASVGLPNNLHACLFTVSLLVVLCTISIFCLVAVSVDRYWAILHPMGYSRNVRTKTAIGIIGVCWVSGTLVGFLPLFGWHNRRSSDQVKCYFTEVMDYHYLVFLYFGTIIVPALVMAGFYAHIYRVVLKQVRRIVTMNPSGGGRPVSGGGTMLRVLGVAQKREVKATQNLSIIVLFFIICWIPLYTINCVQAFCHTCRIPSELTYFCIILSHLNSAINPLLYAYHLRDFQTALRNLICCLLGVKSEEEVNNTRVGRHGSHNTLHHHGVHTPSRNNSIQSIHQSRIQHSTQYTESTVVSTRLSPGANTLVNTIVSSMSSIGTMPLGEEQRERMWTLKEVPSVSEDDGKVCVQLRGENRGRNKSQGEWSSGQVNSAYIEEGVALDYDEDDDVFVPEPIATLSVADLKKQSRTSDICRCHDVDLNQQFELCVRHVKEANGASITDGNQSESRLIIEIEQNNRAVDDNERTELAETGFVKKPIIVAGESRNCRKIELVSNNGQELGTSNASHNNQRLSPLKIVGDFLFPNNTNKLNRTKEQSSVESFKSESTLLEGCDAARGEKDDRNRNDCALRSRDTETL